MTTLVIAGPGKVASHHAEATYCRPSASITPLITVGGSTPKPKNLSDDSAIIVVATSSVIGTITDVITLGNMWRNAVCISCCPMARAATSSARLTDDDHSARGVSWSNSAAGGSNCSDQTRCNNSPASLICWSSNRLARSASLDSSATRMSG